MKTYDVSRSVEPPKQWPLERNKRGEPKKEDLFLFSKLDGSLDSALLGYLKLYQLQKPTLNYGCLLIDESQDLTPGRNQPGVQHGIADTIQESFLHSCRGHSEIDKMFSHVPHARVALEEISDEEPSNEDVDDVESSEEDNGMVSGDDFEGCFVANQPMSPKCFAAA
eukprot:Em0001g2235a